MIIGKRIRDMKVRSFGKLVITLLPKDSSDEVYFVKNKCYCKIIKEKEGV